MLARANFDAWAAAIGKCPTEMKSRSTKTDESLACMWRGLAKGKRGQNVVLSPDAFIPANSD
jgi:hypothetical protein